MTSRTCRSYFSRWTKINARTFRKRENIREREREIETKMKNKCKQIAEWRQREVNENEKQTRRYGASASYVVHTLH